MPIWRRLVQASDWAYLADILSPAIFDVVSPRQFSVRATELARQWFDALGAGELAERLDQVAQSTGLGLRIRAAKQGQSRRPFVGCPADDGRCIPARDGSALLEFFFLQILASDAVFLDLREERFCKGPDETIVYFPLPLWTRWRTDFAQAIRQLYRGFYGEGESSYDQAMKALGLLPARGVFERAFGGASKQASRYTVSGFTRTFHEAFLCCKEAKTAIHPDTLTLGIALATLYDHLETLGGTYDTEACFRRVLRRYEAAFGAATWTGIASDRRNG